MSFDSERSRSRIHDANDKLLKSGLERRILTRDLDFESVQLDEAYLVDAVHMYVEILNMASLAETDGTESERSHKRALRFLHVYQRVVHMVLDAAGAKKIDFQNQRLHLVVYKPKGDEAERIHSALALAALILSVVREGNAFHRELPDARLCVGIESGRALAVNNGTRGDREPLFLGDAANLAAHLLSTTPGVYLGSQARRVLGPAWQVTEPKSSPLPDAWLAAELRDHAPLSVRASTLIQRWEAEVKDTPLAEFQFSRPTPPLSDLDLDGLSPRNSRRIEACSVHADIDGFTKFVSRCLAEHHEPLAVRALHVLRKEMRDVVTDFGGRKIRYIGDCVHGVLAEGARETDGPLTVTKAVLLAAAMRDAFRLVQAAIPETCELGLQIGVDFGPISITRLGVRKDRDRCALGLAVSGSEEVQKTCNPRQTALRSTAQRVASAGVRAIFEKGPVSDITYNGLVDRLRSSDDPTIGSVRTTEAPSNIVIGRAHLP